MAFKTMTGRGLDFIHKVLRLITVTEENADESLTGVGELWGDRDWHSTRTIPEDASQGLLSTWKQMAHFLIDLAVEEVWLPRIWKGLCKAQPRPCAGCCIRHSASGFRPACTEVICYQSTSASLASPPLPAPLSLTRPRHFSLFPQPLPYLSSIPSFTRHFLKYTVLNRSHTSSSA